MNGVRVASWVAALVLQATTAHANSGGRPEGGCSGCHSDGNQNMSVTTSPSAFDPGDAVTVTVTVTAGSGSAVGVFIEPNTGSFETLSGQGLAAVTAGLTHFQPKPMSGGSASFSFRWEAPTAPGAVRFELWSVVTNGNGNSGGDAAADAPFDFVYGCESQQYFRDHDGDGYGRDSDALVHCVGTPPDGYVPMGGDCDDNRDTVYPSAIEYCNLRDDNCNGEVDEEAIPIEQYPDADDDGYFSAAERESGESYLGCVPTKGWAADPGDCQPMDPAINPGAEEVCNGFDDNCDGRVDERVRPQCGVGWCRREATSCDEATCFPGQPQQEECNLLDDDCDDAIDEDAPCPAGEACVVGECQPETGEEDDTGQTADPTGDTWTTASTEPDSAAAPITKSSCRISDPASGPSRIPWFALLLLAVGRRRP